MAAGISVWAVYAGDTLASQATGFSNVLIMAFVAAVVLWGMIKKVPVFAAFISGAKEGIKVSFDIYITLNGGKVYKANIDLELPVNDVVNQGTQSMEYTDLKNIVFKRM